MMDTDGVSRRTFVSIAAVSATVPALAGCTSSGDEGGDSTDDSSDDASGGDSDGEEVVVGPDGDFVFDPEELTIETGTTVTFVWDSDFHNVEVTSQPDDADWEGHEDTEDTGFEFEHTFDVAGTYEYVCTPHEGSGMTGTIVVE